MAELEWQDALLYHAQKNKQYTDDEIRKIGGSSGGSYVTPEQFGAVGDGVADDSQAIQNMFNNASAVWFSGNKQYACSGIVVNNNVKSVEFNGCTFIHKKASSLIRFKDAKNIEITNLNIKREGLGIRGTLLAANGTNIKISNVNVMEQDLSGTPTSGWAFRLEGDNILVENCSIYNDYGERYDGIHFGCCSNVTVSNCKILSGDDCISFFPQPNVGFEYERDGVSKNLRIENCYLQNNRSYSAIKYGTSYDIQDYAIELVVDGCNIEAPIAIGGGGYINSPDNKNRVQMIGCKLECNGTGTYGVFQIEKDFGELSLERCEVISPEPLSRVINANDGGTFTIKDCKIDGKSLGGFKNSDVRIFNSFIVGTEAAVFNACNITVINSDIKRTGRNDYGFSISNVDEKEMIILNNRIYATLQGSSTADQIAKLVIAQGNIGVATPVANFDAETKIYEKGNRRAIVTESTFKGSASNPTDMVRAEINGVSYWIPVLKI